MNNIMIDYCLASKLIDESIGFFEFGTPIDEGGKDIDCVYIMPNYHWWKNAPIDTHHWLHYKGEHNVIHVDFLFTTLSDFYRSLISGTSHIPFEVLLSNVGKLYNTCLSGLDTPDAYLWSYKLLKCYLGLMRKDIKQARQLYINGSVEKLEKKRKFIVESGDLVSYVLSGSDSGLESYEDVGDFLIAADVKCANLKFILNQETEEGNIDRIYNGAIEAAGLFNAYYSIEYPEFSDEVINEFANNAGGLS